MIKSQLKHFKDPSKIKRILVCSGQGQFKADALTYLNQYKNLNSISRILDTTNDLLPNLKLSDYITRSNGANNANNDSNSLGNLQKTSLQQPMLILTSYINYQLYKELYGIELTDHCDYMLGHSLGEITCLVLQDIISFEQGILIAHERGKLMESIVAKELSKLHFWLNNLSTY